MPTGNCCCRGFTSSATSKLCVQCNEFSTESALKRKLFSFSEPFPCLKCHISLLLINFQFKTTFFCSISSFFLFLYCFCHSSRPLAIHLVLTFFCFPVFRRFFAASVVLVGLEVWFQSSLQITHMRRMLRGKNL